jgi:hypothetical protein
MIMKNKVRIIILTLTVILSSCYDRDIIELKEFNHSLPIVENLAYIKEGNLIKLTWQMPADISPDFKRPVETIIQVIENDIYRQVVTVGNENISANITIDTSKKYRFIVKLLGYLTTDSKEVGKTDRVYSAGQVIVVQ